MIDVRGIPRFASQIHPTLVTLDFWKVRTSSSQQDFTNQSVTLQCRECWRLWCLSPSVASLLSHLWVDWISRLPLSWFLSTYLILWRHLAVTDFPWPVGYPAVCIPCNPFLCHSLVTLVHVIKHHDVLTVRKTKQGHRERSRVSRVTLAAESFLHHPDFDCGCSWSVWFNGLPHNLSTECLIIPLNILISVYYKGICECISSFGNH